MKKTVLLSVLLLLAADIAAQPDTLVLNGPKSNYMGDSWFPGGATRLSWSLPTLGNMATYFYTKDSLSVYGIAAIVLTRPLYAEALGLELFDNVADSTLDSVGGYLRMYDAGAGTLISYPEELYINMKHTPVSYYLQYDIDSLYYAQVFPSDFLFPVYERYFKFPVVVTDSFYVGVSNHFFQKEVYDTTPYPRNWIGAPSFDKMHYYDCPALAVQRQDSTWRYWSGFLSSQMFVFPILTPGVNLPDDTIIVDTTIVDTTIVDTTIVDTTIVDTVGIVSAQLLQRYVNVLPNPAAERVQVASSFGLRSIAVYNAAGARVLEQKATGYTATLDIGGLPEGAYLVRIVTPEGTVTKKLLVRRQ